MKLNTSKFPNFEYPQMQLTAFEPIANLSTHMHTCTCICTCLTGFSRPADANAASALDWLEPQQPLFYAFSAAAKPASCKNPGLCGNGMQQKVTHTNNNQEKPSYSCIFQTNPSDAKCKIKIPNYTEILDIIINGTHLVKYSDHKMCWIMNTGLESF